MATSIVQSLPKSRVPALYPAGVSVERYTAAGDSCG
jgi:hypothetical protein